MNLDVTYTSGSELPAKIRNSLSVYLQIPESEIIIPSNEEKYHEREEPSKATQPLEEVFQLMRRLNEVGLEDPRIGATEHQKIPFTQTLRLIIEDIAKTLDGEPIQYTELGPEPSKTKFIMQTLLANKIDIRRYCGVDINPTSRGTMEREIAGLLPQEKIHYHLVLFENLREVEFRLSGIKNLVTMLGFERETSIHTGPTICWTVY